MQRSAEIVRALFRVSRAATHPEGVRACNTVMSVTYVHIYIYYMARALVP